MPSPDDRSVFVRAHEAWAAGDFEGFLSLLDDDIIYIVNVDGMQVPYAMSAVGKTDVQDRLQLLLDTFVVTKFAPEKMVDEAEHSLSVVHGVYRHKKTGEILDIKLRFRAWIANGLITRLEEIHDARFIEAYERFVFHMQNAAEGSGPTE
jgi:ketosteroid isomerase-like protein